MSGADPEFPAGGPVPTRDLERADGGRTGVMTEAAWQIGEGGIGEGEIGEGAIGKGGGPPVDDELADFAEAVGREGPVCVVGGRTQWDVGGLPRPGTREVVAPRGVVAHEPAEMVVRVRAGTTISELTHRLAAAGQMVPFDAAEPDRATVGGLLAVGHSGWSRLRYGPIRDLLLETRYVNADGQIVRAGAPLVKNVTGYDLCRLMVGSLGTLGLFGEVVLRCLPIPETRTWWRAEGADPFALYKTLYRPSAILWDGWTTWVQIEGHPGDVADQAERVLGPQFTEVEGPPASPGPTRRSLPPTALGALTAAAGPGGWLAEVGVGTVHLSLQAAALLGPPAAPDARSAELSRRVKAQIDPGGRLNPGRALVAP